jgi:hypothetical protein
LSVTEVAQAGSESVAHKLASAKIIVNWIFRFKDMFKFQSFGIGKDKIAISVAALTAPPTTKTILMGIHFPSMVRSQSA